MARNRYAKKSRPLNFDQAVSSKALPSTARSARHSTTGLHMGDAVISEAPFSQEACQYVRSLYRTQIKERDLQEDGINCHRLLISIQTFTSVLVHARYPLCPPDQRKAPAKAGTRPDWANFPLPAAPSKSPHQRALIFSDGHVRASGRSYMPSCCTLVGPPEHTETASPCGQCPILGRHGESHDASPAHAS